MKNIILIIFILISCGSFAQTKFSYNSKGGMLKASFAGGNPCPVQTGRELVGEASKTTFTDEAKQELLLLSVTPNPATNISRVQCDLLSKKEATLRLTNAVGTTLTTITGKTGAFIHVQDVRALPAGTYWWVLTVGNDVKAVQWVKM